jgi:hypothetical protein
MEDQCRFHEMYSPTLQIVNGELRIPDEGYGWGVTIKREWLDKAEYRLSDLAGA